MKIALACDHGGLNLKREIIAYLEANGYEYEDFGTNRLKAATIPTMPFPQQRRLLRESVTGALLYALRA